MTIPPTGGLASFADGALTLRAFADASRAPLTLQYQAVDARTLPTPQSGLSLGFNAFQLSAVESETLGFGVPMNLVVTPGASDLALALGNVERLYMGTWNGSVWLAVPCAPDAVTGTRLVCSVTRLGLFALLVTLPINPALDRFDIGVANGHFYAQGNGFGGGGGLGYTVSDDDDAPLWSAFQRQGGVQRLGYPVTQRFVRDGYVTQVFQRAALQWLPEAGGVQFVGLMDALHARGVDEWLDATHQIPPAPPGGAPSDVSILSPFPSIVAAYNADPDLYGLPVAVKDYGQLGSARFQQSTLQTFAGSTDVIPGTPGEWASATGLWPISATTPVQSPAS